MEKFIFTFSVVTNGVYNIRNSFTVDSCDFEKTVDEIKSRGFRFDIDKCCLVKTFKFDDGTSYFVYRVARKYA